MDDLLKISVLAVALAVSQGVSAQTASSVMPSSQEQIASQEARVKELIAKMVALDASIQARIDKVVSDLKALQDSPDSGTRLTFVKQETIKKLNNVVKAQRAERDKRLAAMRTGASYLTKDQLTNDIALLEARIETRVSDIIGLVESLEKKGEVAKYSSSSGDPSDASRHARRVEGRAGLVEGKVEKGLDADAKKLEDENVSLKRDLLYKKGADRELVENQIKTNEELIQKRKQQATLNVGSGASQPEKEVSAKEAFRIEQSLKLSVDEIKADFQKLFSLRAQYDQARISLNLSRSMLKK